VFVSTGRATVDRTIFDAEHLLFRDSYRAFLAGVGSATSASTV